tara:strand:+ start:478 stop:723 length:246 start_codon:yes stop_codon:yes gene_type:complete
MIGNTMTQSKQFTRKEIDNMAKMIIYISDEMKNPNGWTMLGIADKIADLTESGTFTGEASDNKQFTKNIIIDRTGANKWIA